MELPLRYLSLYITANTNKEGQETCRANSPHRLSLQKLTLLPPPTERVALWTIIPQTENLEKVGKQRGNKIYFL